MLTAGSLFSGIGGIDVAFAAVGFDIRWQVEIDAYCRRVLAKHAPEYWPNAKRYKDVTHVGREQLEPVDVMFGGFPCQDISVAGKRAGIKRGTRSGLWFEFSRIIGELRPRTVLLENVATITTAGLGGDIVVGSLAEIGYDAIWIPLRAADVGAPHKRERWFCIAMAEYDGQRRDDGANNRRRGRVSENKKGLCSETSKEWKKRLSGARSPSQTLADDDGKANINGEAQSRVGRNVHGIPGWLDRPQWPAGFGAEQYDYEPPRETIGDKNRTARLKALGNAVVPQVVFPLAETIRDYLLIDNSE